MMFSFGSWEFVAALNLLAVVVWPWRPRVNLLFYHLLPFALLALESLLAGPIPFSYSAKLIFLHWNLSLLGLQALESLSSKKLYFATVFLSILITLSGLLISESLILLDPFWGVLPGTVGLDALISFEAYYTRGAIILVCALFSFLILNSKRYRGFVYLSFYWILILGLGLFYRSSIQTTRALTKQFGEKSLSPQIEVYVEDPSTSLFSASVWAKEFSFWNEKLSQKLPQKAEFSREQPDRVFVYRSDQSKALWIGARETQIGNFIQGSIHLSEILPYERLIPHEFAHLLHGRLSAPLSSYLDPFLFEGFAEALSHPKREILFSTASAFINQQGADNFEWPRFTRFFFSGNPRANYRLAAAYSAFALSRSKFPWHLEEDPKAEIAQFPTSQQDREWAERMAQIRGVFREPERRYCAWVQYRFHQRPQFVRFLEVKRFCKDGETLYRNIFKLKPPDRTDAWLSLAPNLAEVQGDLHALEAKWSEAREHYVSCQPHWRCELKSRLTMFPESASRLRAWLLSDSVRDLELLNLFREDSSMQRKSLEWVHGFDRLTVYENLLEFDRLTPQERIDYERLRFYQSLLRTSLATNPDGPRELAAQILKEMNPETWRLPEGVWFKSRLEFELGR